PLNPFPFLYIPQFSRFTLLVYLTLSQKRARKRAGRGNPGGPFSLAVGRIPFDYRTRLPARIVAGGGLA
ncbi:hypothetical protein, partial [Pseudomonas aeruginosa]|uniref:hypothetical protein n=1 Tax=Pseudomonas aeruginosa TaxID=287 RepID=UPI001C3F7A78